MADINALKEAGMPIDQLSEAQQEAVKSLDDSEVEALVAIRRKLDSNMADVSGYAMRDDSSGYVVW